MFVENISFPARQLEKKCKNVLKKSQVQNIKGIDFDIFASFLFSLPFLIL